MHPINAVSNALHNVGKGRGENLSMGYILDIVHSAA